MNYSDRTTKTFKLKPLDEFGKSITSAPYDFELNFPKDTLRILEDDKLFKDFLSTMFVNENKQSGNVVSDLSKVKIKKAVSRKNKSKLRTFHTTTAYSTLSDIEEDIEDVSEDNPNKVAGRSIITKSVASTSKLSLYDVENDVSDLAAIETKSKTSPSLPRLLYDSEDNVAGLIEIKKKRNSGRKPKSKLSTSSMFNNNYDDISDLTQKNTKKVGVRKIKTVSITTSTELPILYDETEYTEEYSKENKGNMQKQDDSDIPSEDTNKNDEKNNQNNPKLKATAVESMDSITTHFTKYSNKDINDLDIDELMKAIVEANTNTNKVPESVLEPDQNQNSKLNKHIEILKEIKTKQTFSTPRSFLHPMEEKEYVDEYDEKYQPNMKANNENADTIDNTMSNNEDSTLEKDINNLLDNLDLRKLLESDESTSVQKKESRSTEHLKKIKEKNISEEKNNKISKVKKAQIISYSYESTEEDSVELNMGDLLF